MQPPAEDDDGFGEFRKAVAGLKDPERQAALKQMEDSILENLRTNVLADLYAADSGGEEMAPAPAVTPAPAPVTPPAAAAPPAAAPSMSRSLIDDAEPDVFADVASPTKFQEKPMGPGAMGAAEAKRKYDAEMASSEKYPDVQDEEAEVERLRKSRGDSEPEQYENYGVSDKWLEWRYQDASPQQLQKTFQREKAALDRMVEAGEDGGDGYYQTKQLVEFLQNKMNNTRTPAPGYRSGAFGRPPGGATRMMIDQ